MIFNIQRYSTHDGPGIRTVVFLKGCSLGCLWCQNPESRSRKQELLFDKRLCMEGCDLCHQTAPDVIERTSDGLRIQRDKLTGLHFLQLQECCPTQALSVCGIPVDLDAIITTVMRDRPFYERSGGGLTLSGGEPFMQADIAHALLQRCHADGIHTAVETCLAVPWSYIEPALDDIDLFLADLKHTDPEPFKQWTNGSAQRVMDNLKKIANAGKSLVIRVPIIPDFNADETSLRNIIDFTADELHVSDIHFLPYHTLGMNKYVLLNQPYLAAKRPLEAPELLRFAEDYAHAKGLTVTLRG